MSDFKKAVPGVPADKMVMRLDIFTESLWLHRFNESGKMFSSKPIDPDEITTKLLERFPMSTGLLPDNTLWWRNSPGGPQVGIFVPGRIRQLYLAKAGEVKRYQIPVPDMVFACQGGRPPQVFAVKRKPKKNSELFKAPFPNVFQFGATCGGSVKYPTDVEEIPEAFFRSHFSPEADLRLRSVTFPENICDLWGKLEADQAKEFPDTELVSYGRTLGETIG